MWPFKKASFLPLLPDLIAFVLVLRLAAGQRTVVKYFPPEGLLTVTKKQTNPPTNPATDWLTDQSTNQQPGISLSLSLPYSSFNTKRRHAKVGEGQTLVLAVGAPVGRGLNPYIPPTPHLPLPLLSIGLLLPLRMLRGKAQKHLLVQTSRTWTCTRTGHENRHETETSF